MADAVSALVADAVSAPGGLVRDGIPAVAAAVCLIALAVLPAPVAVAAGVALAVTIAIAPRISVPVVIATLPLYLHPRSFGGTELSLTEIAIVLSAAGVLARATIERGGGGAVRAPRPSVVDWGAAAILTAALLSLLVTDYPKQSLRELRWLVVEPLMVLYIARSTIFSGLQIRVVLWTLVGAGVAATVVTFAALLARGDLLDPTSRATEPYLSPNHLGLFLGRAGAVALALALFVTRKPAARVGESTVAWASFAVIGAGVLRTVSLGAWAGLTAAVLALTALAGRRWLVAAVLGLVVLLSAALIVLPSGRTTGRLDPTTGTALFRVQIWTSSLRMIADHPVLGVGLDNFLYLYRDGYMLPEAAEEPNISHPHNWLLHFWLELGLLGVVAAVGLLVWIARSALRLVHSPVDRAGRVLGAAAIGVFVDTLVHGSLDNSYFLVDAAVIWWTFIALLVVWQQATEAGGQPVPPSTVELRS